MGCQSHCRRNDTVWVLYTSQSAASNGELAISSKGVSRPVLQPPLYALYPTSKVYLSPLSKYSPALKIPRTRSTSGSMLIQEVDEEQRLLGAQRNPQYHTIRRMKVNEIHSLARKRNNAVVHAAAYSQRTAQPAADYAKPATGGIMTTTVASKGTPAISSKLHSSAALSAVSVLHGAQLNHTGPCKIVAAVPKNKSSPGRVSARPQISPPLYCSCRQPYDKRRTMLQCESCEEWFHLACAGLTVIPSAADSFVCAACSISNTAAISGSADLGILTTSMLAKHQRKQGTTRRDPTSAKVLISYSVLAQYLPPSSLTLFIRMIGTPCSSSVTAWRPWIPQGILHRWKNYSCNAQSWKRLC